MFSFAKLWADILKYLGAPTGFLTHSLIAILFAGGSWYANSFYRSKNDKIESVPVILNAIDTLRKEVKDVKRQICNLEMVNKSGHDSMKLVIRTGFGKVQEAFNKTNDLNNQKFLYLNRNIEEKFSIPDRWLDELINRISYEKKNETPYRLTQIP